jgi:UDPglucose 6-dehydrogenase
MDQGTLCIVGLGKLGMPIAACLASKGFRIYAVDQNPQTLQKLAQGIAPVFEPGLDELIQQNRERLLPTDNYEDAIQQSSISFLLVPTPSDRTGGFSLEYVLQSCRSIGRVLRKKSQYHLVVLTSTVMPGSTETKVRPVLEQESGKICGKDFGLCYSPEFVALGSVIQDFLHPDFYLIGESDPKAGETLSKIYQKVCNPTPPISRMNYVNAEITKLALNTFVTTKITFANMLARICEQLPDANVDTVTGALGLDSRIGRKYLMGAIGYGGPCFPRDNLALTALISNLGLTAKLPEIVHRSNRDEVKNLHSRIKSELGPGQTVGILGIAYKPNTTVVEESQGLLLAQSLDSETIPVIIYDPVAMDNARNVLSKSVRFANSLQECMQLADLIVIATPWKEFRALPLQGENTKTKLIIDCWRLLNPESFVNHSIQYVQLGRGSK